MSVSAQDVVRASEIALSVAGPLLREIGEALAEGLDEEAATRRALQRLADAPDLRPVLPRVQAMIADARSGR